MMWCWGWYQVVDVRVVVVDVAAPAVRVITSTSSSTVVLRTTRKQTTTQADADSVRIQRPVVRLHRHVRCCVTAAVFAGDVLTQQTTLILTTLTTVLTQLLRVVELLLNCSTFVRCCRPPTTDNATTTNRLYTKVKGKNGK